MAKIQDPAWNAWTDKFLSLKGDQVQPMRPMQSQAFISMTFVERDETACKGLEGDLNKDFLYQVMAKRAEYYGLKYTVPLLAFVRYLCNSPGVWVMWIHALKRLEIKNGGKTVNIEALAHAFPVGFPTDAALSTLWNEQKGLDGAVDNYLDTVAA